MINNGQSIDTIVLGGAMEDDTITLTGWDSLPTSLTDSYTYPSATLGAATATVGATESVGSRK